MKWWDWMSDFSSTKLNTHQMWLLIHKSRKQHFSVCFLSFSGSPHAFISSPPFSSPCSAPLYLKYLLVLFHLDLDSSLQHLVEVYGVSDGKEAACKAGDLDLIPGLARSPGEGNGTPLQYSCLENPMDWGAWQATVHGVAKSQTRLSNTSMVFSVPSPLFLSPPL